MKTKDRKGVCGILVNGSCCRGCLPSLPSFSLSPLTHPCHLHTRVQVSKLVGVKPQFTMAGHGSTVWSLALAGDMVWSASSDGTVKVRRCAIGRVVAGGGERNVVLEQSYE